MRRVVSLFLPHLAVERLRRLERPATPLPERPALQLPVDDDPGACSVPRGGGWRPGARWAREGTPARDEVEAQIAALPRHAQPPMRDLGRRSEAASNPFKGATPAARLAPGTSTPIEHTPLVLIGKVGRREEVVAACGAATALGIQIGMAATHARAMVSDLDFRPADPGADAALLDRLALLAVRRWSPIAAVTPSDGLWIDLTGCDHLHGGEERFCRRLLAFCRRAGFTARIAVADTAGAAHALARFGTADLIQVDPGATTRFIAPLPIAALRLAPSVLVAARKFGFERVADLLPVARGPLARRLGLPTITRLDQALGAVAEPITPREDAELPIAECRLMEPVGTAEAIEQVVALNDLKAVYGRRGYMALFQRRRPNDAVRIDALAAQAGGAGVRAVVTGDVLYHAPEARLLQDVVTAVREKCTVDELGYRREVNADRALKSPDEMVRRFRGYPNALRASVDIANACTFDLGELAYQYPHERLIDGLSAQEALQQLAAEAVERMFDGDVPPAYTEQIAHEMRLIGELGYAPSRRAQ